MSTILENSKMREILFRAWDMRKKCMYSAEEMGIDQLTIIPDGRGFINVSGISTKLSTFLSHLIPEQYIGLTDKNGVKIWEGDIYKIFDDTKENKIYEIIYEKGCFLAKAPDGMKYYAYTWADNCKVIGNIHNNPELLKATECQTGKNLQ